MPASIRDVSPLTSARSPTQLNGDDSSLIESSEEGTDVFIVLPGVKMDDVNLALLNVTVASVRALYPENYIHFVYNTGDPTYHQLKDTLRTFHGQTDEDGLIQHNNFALGGFICAADWMERFRPNGNFIILQHSISLDAKAQPPGCDIELVNMRQRCGDTCEWAVHDPQNLQMLTNFGTATCFSILNDIMGLYNFTCGFPCCPWSNEQTMNARQHFVYWPLMAHNAVMFTPRARKFLRPLRDYVASLPANTLTKIDDMGTERLFGLLSSIMLNAQGSIRHKLFRGTPFRDPLQAFKNGVFTCAQDLTTKKHGRLHS